jgi:FAD/FMN-containing dehydrogenase
MRRGVGAAALALVAACANTAPRPPDPPNTVNDVTQLNPIAVERVVAPTSVEEISRLIAGHSGPISIGGGRFSQGGQTACTGCLFLDMKGMNRILNLDAQTKTVTVEAGATWRQLQEFLDTKDLSPKIMQSFSNFTIGGSISVNCHGDYVGLGPIVESVRSIKLVLADGAVVTASSEQNRDLFTAAVGGYGGIGVIVEATLDLADNSRLERITHRMKIVDYPAWHAVNILKADNVVLHHAVIYPPSYTRVAAEVSTLTNKPVTVKDRLAPQDRPSGFELAMLDFVTRNPLGQFFHENIYDPLTSASSAVVWRNYEAAQDVYSLEPASRAKSTYALQEYFVPVARFDEFAARMAKTLNSHKANVLNVAIRHTRADRETLLSWAREDVYSFVLYYEQGTSEAAKAKVGEWARELVEAAIDEGGSFYLPYQIHATREQFLKAYPRAAEYFAIKRRVDSEYKFRNRLWEAYYR